MKKCVFILPYFGTFKNYFPLFLKSCSRNPDFDWLLITDNTEPYPYPDNVQVFPMSFEAMQEKAQERFDFPISLTRPYKLCDYRPAYGYLFEEYIKEYEWWGYCDCDVILGDLAHFLFPLFEKQYDKIFAAGHMTIYRNTREINRRFMNTCHGEQWYRRGFSTPDACCFDEDYRTEKYQNHNIHHIFLEDHAKVYQTDHCFGISVTYSQFLRAQYAAGTGRFPVQPYEKALYVWDNGDLKQITAGENGELQTKRYIYMHFHARKMKYNDSVYSEPLIQIYPNGFRKLEKLPVSREEWERLARFSPNLHRVGRKWYDIKRAFKRKINRKK